MPTPQPGQVLIKVRAFGLNRSERHTRLGLSLGVSFPRVLTCVPVRQVVPFSSALDWAVLGAVPEMLQTARGSLTVGLDAQRGQSLLIRGGTSSVGMATSVLAKRLGMTVVSTTRSSAKEDARKLGVDHVVIDDGGNVARQVRAILPGGVDAALELIGTPTLPDTLRAVRVHGVVCFTGMLSNEWTVRDFYPIEYLPRGVRLTAYGGDATDLPSAVLQEFLDAVAAGRVRRPDSSHGWWPLQRMQAVPILDACSTPSAAFRRRWTPRCDSAPGPAARASMRPPLTP